MSRQIVIEFPDSLPDDHYRELVDAVSTLVEARLSVDPAGPRAVVRPDGYACAPVPPVFMIVLRGYDRGQVDAWAGRVLGSTPPYETPMFDVVLRGYDRAQVDAWVSWVLGGSGGGR